MQEQKNIIAIQLRHTTIDWLSNQQSSSNCFDGDMGNLYPYKRPWYIQAQT
ncbi:MAG: hypothetical protein ABJB11_08540 [Ferruginibacter sp.]